MTQPYWHADTVDVSRDFVYVEYGTPEDIMLGRDSNRVKGYFPIRSHNIRATLEVPDNVKVVVPKTGTLFSLDNVVDQSTQHLVFQTMYFNIGKYIVTEGYWDMQAIEKNKVTKREYTPEDLTNRPGEQGTDKLFRRYQNLLKNIVGKEHIDMWEDIMEVACFVNDRINAWEHGPGRPADDILDDIDRSGRYEGNCTEQQTMTRWLLSVGGIYNREINGHSSSEKGTLARKKYEGNRGGLHAWNEFGVCDGEKPLWIPLDWGNVPYLRKDSLMVHRIGSYLPGVIAKTERDSELFKCRLTLEEIKE